MGTFSFVLKTVPKSMSPGKFLLSPRKNVEASLKRVCKSLLKKLVVEEAVTSLE